MNKLSMIIAVLCLHFGAHAQILSPAKWSYAAKKTGKYEAILYVKAEMQQGWHIYSTAQPTGGPTKTSITFKPSADYSLIGSLVEPKPKIKFDNNYGINLLTLENLVVFQQKVRLKKPKTVITGSVEFMVCNNHQCLSPETVEFSIPIK